MHNHVPTGGDHLWPWRLSVSLTTFPPAYAKWQRQFIHKLGQASSGQTLHMHYGMLHNTYVWCMHCTWKHMSVCACVCIHNDIHAHICMYICMYIHVKQNNASCDACMQGMGCFFNILISILIGLPLTSAWLYLSLSLWSLSLFWIFSFLTGCHKVASD